MKTPGQIKLVTAEFCNYTGSFTVVGADPAARAEYVRKQLQQMRELGRSKPILLVISLAGIKVCSPDGKTVYMAHALRRISYATCDPDHRQFSFLAREPKGHFSVQYCHAFLTHTPDQAEELNSIVGHAFRLAYAAHLQKPSSDDTPQKTDHVIPTTHILASQHPPSYTVSAPTVTTSPNSIPNRTDHVIPTTHILASQHPPSYTVSAPTVTTSPNSIPQRTDQAIPTTQLLVSQYTPTPPMPAPAIALSPNSTPTHKQKTNRRQKHCKNVSGSSSRTSSPSGAISAHSCGSGSDTMRIPDSESPVPEALCKPSTLPDLHFNSHHHLNPLSPDNSNSSTELNSSERLEDKPPLINKLSVNIENNLENTIGNTIDNTLENNLETEDDSQPLVKTNTSSSSSSSFSSSSWGSSHHQVGKMTSSKATSQVTTATSSSASTTSTAIVGYANDKLSDATSTGLASESQCQEHNIKCIQLPEDAKLKRISQISVSSSASSGIVALDLSTSSTHSCTPPPLPDRLDSLTPPEEPHLKSAAWFQAGIPREIALEVLNREPVGAFMVRESTSKPGCYALSLRVPRDFTVSGIAHYLIVKNSNGYKIKGFTKEFATLTALITHHSVMPELLPCPLSLSRYNPTFTNDDHNKADQNDDDPDYNTLSDFRKMMADLNV